MGKRFRRCDLLWRKERLALEYQGAVHADRARVGDGSKRAAELADRGIATHTVAAGQMASLPEMDRLAGIVARATGFRLRPSTRVATPAREALRRWVFERGDEAPGAGFAWMGGNRANGGSGARRP